MISKTKCLIWGAGFYLDVVLESIDHSSAEVLAILDRDTLKQGTKIRNIIVAAPETINEYPYDLVIISSVSYEGIVEECIRLGVDPSKIVAYCDDSKENPVFISRSVQTRRLLSENERLRFLIDSLPYEWGLKNTPHIREGIELFELIKNGRSLVRFGDGEFEIIRGRNRACFQKCDETLGKKLKLILQSDDENIVVAVAQNFLLDKYTEEASNAIRSYMFGETREDIIKLLGEREYYDAYISRPYLMYKDKTYAEKVFGLFGELFEERQLLVVEGKYSRMGVGNDFFATAASVRRILCPSSNSWDHYDVIKEAVKNNAKKDNLILVSLGPTATVLCYDLSMLGFHAVDIGQIDNEYEWWKRGAAKRIPIEGKMVAELPSTPQELSCDDMIYESQIVQRISV